MNYNVLHIAKKILARGSDFEYGELICNLKLQKILYYMQGFHLARFDTPLFEEDIEAWMYGPAVPCVYEKYKCHGNQGIYIDGEVIQLQSKEESLFDDVFRQCEDYSAIGLMNLICLEYPYKSTPIGLGNIITKDKMNTFFKKRLI
jgi:uncharacterized phage-associated protein